MSIAVNIFALTFYFTPSVPIPYRAMVTLILQPIINSMACKVFRDVRFGRISDLATIKSNTRRATGKSLPFHAASRSRGDVFVSMDVTTTRTEGTRPSLADSGPTATQMDEEVARTPEMKVGSEIFGQA